MYYPIETYGYGIVGYMHYSSQSISLSIVICATSTKPISTIRDGIRQAREEGRGGEVEGERERERGREGGRTLAHKHK
jgi:hypothetical protein